MRLLDRRDEREALDRVLEAARNGLSGVLVLRGDPGVGKTSLLEYAAAEAAGFRVALVRGVESEMDLPFAGLHRLLLPFLPGVAELPPPQRHAMEAAFGLAHAPPPDRFRVGLATLSLLAEAAVDQPLLCVVDDVQWLDQESLAALGLVGRRLFADRITLVLGARLGFDDGGSLAGIPDAVVGGLPDGDAAELLRLTVGGVVDRELARRIMEETHGSPLGILELVAGLTAQQLSGRDVPPDPLPLSGRLEAHFLRQVGALGAATRAWLLAAAAEPSGDLRVVEAAAARLGCAPEDAVPAIAHGLFVRDPESRFRHPLIRSAVYRGASEEDRRRTHDALAAVTDPVLDPDRRAWHLAAAAVGPDEAVAVELERAADRGRVRGGHSTAGLLLARAAELTPDDGHRTGRLLAAVGSHLAGGSLLRALALLDEAAHDIVDPLDRARARRLRGSIGYALGEAAGTASTLMDAARALDPFDRCVARATLLEALAAARVTGRLTAPGGGERDVSRLALAMPLPPGVAPTVGDLFLDGYATLFLDGHAGAVPALQRAIAALRGSVAPTTTEALMWLAVGCWGAGAIGDDEALHALADRLVATAREQGAAVWLSIGLMFLAMSELLAGSVDDARRHFAERAEIMQAIGRPSDVGELVVSAWRGREEVARREAAALGDHGAESGHGWLLPFVEYALAVLELGLGSYQAAFDVSTKDFTDNPFLGMVAFPDLIEAAVRCGRREAAEVALATYAPWASSSGTHASLGSLARSRALLADGAEAEARYRESIEHGERCRGDLQLARTRLLYGEWLRRRRRRADARVQLRAAHDLFVRMGASAFAERAHVELAATGERARTRTVDTDRELTPQEHQVALLASRGDTNPEIAATLFLSRWTVDHHLRTVYRKLGVSSRRHLPQAMADG